MYHTPRDGVKEYGVLPPVELLEGLRQEVIAYGMYIVSIIIFELYLHHLLDPDEYLPPVTLDWCRIELEKSGIDLSIKPNMKSGVPVYLNIYSYLRLKLEELFNKGDSLPICSVPDKAYKWQAAHSAAEVELEVDCELETSCPIYQLMEGDKSDTDIDE